MKSAVIKRSNFLNGRKTSVSLENEFWDALREITGQRKIALSTLVEQIDKERHNINLSSAIRVFVFNHLRPLNGQKAEPGLDSARPRADIPNLWARECRAKAEGSKDARTRAVMLKVAADYEFMAEWLKCLAEAEHQHEELPMMSQRGPT